MKETKSILHKSLDVKSFPVEINAIDWNQSTDINNTTFLNLFYDTISDKLIQIIDDKLIIYNSKGVKLKEMNSPFLK